MSEFLAEAKVLVRPDVTGFRAALTAQLAAVTKGVVVPVTVAPVAAGGITSLAGATSGLVASQKALIQSSAGVAGAQAAVAATTQKSTAALLGAGSATAKLDAALLGLRTAVGSTAVIGLGALALGAIVAGKALRGSLQAFADFQTALLTFRATTGATADEMKRVSQAAIRLGADVRLPSVSAGDAAVAMTELAKAGLSVEESIAGAEGVLQLATAAQLSNADAALIAANALNSFGLEGTQAVRVADDLANAANAAQGSIADFGLALSQVASVGRQVGLSLEDTTSLLSLLAKNGLRGSDAGTSLRVALLRLVAPTQQAAGLIKTLNISVRDLQGNVRADVFAQFAEATAALSPAVRDAVAALVFGQDAIRAVAIAGREGADGLKLMRFQIDQQGTAAELAAARTSGLAGAYAGLSSNLETLGVNFGRAVTGPLEDFINSLSRIVVVANKSSDAIARLSKVPIPDFFGGGRTEKEAQGFIDTAKEVGKRGLGPQAGFVFALNAAFDIYGKVVTTADEKTKKLLETLLLEQKALEGARIAAQRGGATGVADRLTGEIKAIRETIRQVKIDAGLIFPESGAVTKAAAPLRKALEFLAELKDIKVAKGLDTTGVDRTISLVSTKLRTLTLQIAQAGGVINKLSFEDLTRNLKVAIDGFKLDPTGVLAAAFLKDAKRIANQITKIGPDVSRAAKQAFGKNLVTPFQDAINAAIEEGDLKSAQKIKAIADRIMSSLGINLKAAGKQFVIPAMQDAIDAALQPSTLAIAQAQAGGNQSAELAGLRSQRDAAQALIDAGNLTVDQLIDQNNLIASINAQIRGIYEDRNQVQDAANQKIQDAKDKAEKTFITGMENALKPSERLALRADRTESLKDDIKFQKQIIAILNAKKDAVLKILGNTAAARQIVSDIQDRILVEAGKLKTDQANFRKQLRDALISRLDRIRTGIELDVELADINENTRRRISLRQKLIENLKKERKKLHLTGNALKENRNEIARINAEIKAIQGETKQTGNAFKELTFQFLQTQQGFAANLLGNLIPGGATGGLVGGASGPAQGMASAAFTPATSVQKEAAVAGSRDRGVRPVQVDTTNHLLRSILRSLQSLNGRAGHPEARHQKATLTASMDVM